MTRSSLLLLGYEPSSLTALDKAKETGMFAETRSDLFQDSRANFKTLFFVRDELHRLRNDNVA